MDTSNNIRLSIVFLNFNRLEETRFTSERLLEMINGRSDIEIIAVDNNSADGTAEYLNDQSSIKSILLKENGGIAGYNKGFELARGEYILVLDDDSCPQDYQTLDRIVGVLDSDSAIGVVACHIETPDGTPQWDWHLPHEYKPGKSPFFIGCGFAIRRLLFEKINWYPEAFFIYQNEIDVSFKVRMEGYEIFYDPDCRVVHRGVPSERPGWRCVFYPTRNTIWLIKKYYPQPMATYMIVSRLVIGLGRALYLGQLATYFKAVKEAFAPSIEKQLLPKEIRHQFAPFWRQNSIFHQVLGLT